METQDRAVTPPKVVDEVVRIIAADAERRERLGAQVAAQAIITWDEGIVGT